MKQLHRPRPTIASDSLPPRSTGRPKQIAIARGSARRRGCLAVASVIVGALAFVLASGVPSATFAQSAPAPQPEAASATKSAAKSAPRKAGAKVKTGATPSAPAESGPCQVGVIPALGDQFVVQKIGLTVFNNEEAEIPVPAWGLDDLVVTRVRAAAPGLMVRRLGYAKAAFDPYYHPPSRLFGDSRNDLTTIVRQIAATARCERYLVVTRFDGQLAGTNQTLSGIGVFNRGIGVLTQSALFANVNATMFDGQTFEIIKPPLPSLGDILSAGLVQDPLTKLDNADFPATAADSAGSATLRDHTRALLAARLDKILPAHFKQQP